MSKNFSTERSTILPRVCAIFVCISEEEFEGIMSSRVSPTRKRLPRYVVDCSLPNKKRRRYGAKLKLCQKSIRIGSNYADMNSASKVAEAAKRHIVLKSDGSYVLNPPGLKLLKTCLVYSKRKLQVEKRGVLSILQEFVRVKNAKHAWKLGRSVAKDTRELNEATSNVKGVTSIMEGIKDMYLCSTEELQESANFLLLAYQEDLCDIQECLCELSESLFVLLQKNLSQHARDNSRNSRTLMDELNHEINCSLEKIRSY